MPFAQAGGYNKLKLKLVLLTMHYKERPNKHFNYFLQENGESKESRSEESGPKEGEES